MQHWGRWWGMHGWSPACGALPGFPSHCTVEGQLRLAEGQAGKREGKSHPGMQKCDPCTYKHTLPGPSLGALLSHPPQLRSLPGHCFILCVLSALHKPLVRALWMHSSPHHCTQGMHETQGPEALCICTLWLAKLRSDPPPIETNGKPPLVATSGEVAFKAPLVRLFFVHQITISSCKKQSSKYNGSIRGFLVIPVYICL